MIFEILFDIFSLIDFFLFYNSSSELTSKTSSCNSISFLFSSSNFPKNKDEKTGECSASSWKNVFLFNLQHNECNNSLHP